MEIVFVMMVEGRKERKRERIFLKEKKESNYL